MQGGPGKNIKKFPSQREKIMVNLVPESLFVVLLKIAENITGTTNALPLRAFVNNSVIVINRQLHYYTKLCSIKILGEDLREGKIFMLYY